MYCVSCCCASKPRVAQLRLRVVLRDARPNDLLFARSLIEEREAQVEAHRLRVRITIVAPAEAAVRTVAAAIELQRIVGRYGVSALRTFARAAAYAGLGLLDGGSAQRERRDLRAVGVRARSTPTYRRASR